MRRCGDAGEDVRLPLRRRRSRVALARAHRGAGAQARRAASAGTSSGRVPAEEQRKVEQRVKGLLRVVHRRVEAGQVVPQAGDERWIAAAAKAATVGPKLPAQRRRSPRRRGARRDARSGRLESRARTEGGNRRARRPYAGRCRAGLANSALWRHLEVHDYEPRGAGRSALTALPRSSSATRDRTTAAAGLLGPGCPPFGPAARRLPLSV